MSEQEKKEYPSSKKEPGIVELTLKAEAQDLLNNSINLKRAIDSSKTSTKIKYLKKKLKANNEKLFEVLVALERVRPHDNTESDSTSSENTD